MLANEDELLHAVTNLFVPVATEAGISLHELLQLIFGHGGIPLACIADADLLASLLKDVADIFFVLEVADAFCADDTLGPFAGYELIEESQVEGAATEVYVSTDAVFLSLTLIVMMVVMMVPVFMMTFIFLMMLMFVVVITGTLCSTRLPSVP